MVAEPVSLKFRQQEDAFHPCVQVKGELYLGKEDASAGSAKI